MNLRQRDKQLHFGAGAIAAALAYLWSFWLLGREKKTLRFGFAVFTALTGVLAQPCRHFFRRPMMFLRPLLR